MKQSLSHTDARILVTSPRTGRSRGSEFDSRQGYIETVVKRKGQSFGRW